MLLGGTRLYSDKQADSVTVSCKYELWITGNLRSSTRCYDTNKKYGKIIQASSEQKTGRCIACKNNNPEAFTITSPIDQYHRSPIQAFYSHILHSTAYW